MFLNAHLLFAFRRSQLFLDLFRFVVRFFPNHFVRNIEMLGQMVKQMAFYDWNFLAMRRKDVRSFRWVLIVRGVMVIGGMSAILRFRNADMVDFLLWLLTLASHIRPHIESSH